MINSLGWRIDLEETDELQAESRVFRSAIGAYEAPAAIDHRSWLKVEHQGNLGSCTGHAMSTCGEICEYIDTEGNVTQLNRMFAYLMGQKVSGLLGQDQGATIYGVVKAAMSYGMAPEDIWPYRNVYTTKVPENVYPIAKQHKIKQFTEIKDYADAFDFLATGTGAIIIGIKWRSGHANAGKTLTKDTGRVIGGHALALTGYVDEKWDGEKPLIMTNSHGTGWGDKGHTLVAPELIDRWAKDRYTEMYGVSDLEEYGEIRKPVITALI